MLNDYMNNINNILAVVLFTSFKIIVVIFTILLILSLIFLAIACLIKSQKMKSKFLKIVPSFIFGIIFILTLPLIFLYFKNHNIV